MRTKRVPRLVEAVSNVSQSGGIPFRDTNLSPPEPDNRATYAKLCAVRCVDFVDSRCLFSYRPAFGLLLQSSSISGRPSVAFSLRHLAAQSTQRAWPAETLFGILLQLRMVWDRWSRRPLI